MFADTISEKTACFLTRLPLSRYRHKLQRNCNNYKMYSVLIAAHNETNNNNASNKDLKGFSDDNPDKLYRVYN